MTTNLFPQEILNSLAYFNTSITTAAVKKYVDVATGSDTTGTGTAAFPYASPLRAYADIPRIAAHKCEIEIKAGAYGVGSWPRRIDTTIVGNGSLTIYGKGAPTRKAVRGGPHSVTGIADVGAVGKTQKVTVAAAAGWVADEFCGYYLRVVTGGHVGRTFAVIANTTTEIYIRVNRLDTDIVHNGDTVELIAPTTTIAIEDFELFYDARSSYWPLSTSSSSRITLANLWFDGTGSMSNTQFTMSGTKTSEGPCLDLVRIDAVDYGIYITGATVGRGTPLETGYVAASDAACPNMGELISCPGWVTASVGGRAGYEVYMDEEASISACTAMGIISGGSGRCDISDSAAAAIYHYGPSAGSIFATVLAGVDAATDACSLTSGIWDTVVFTVIGACQYALYLDYGAIIQDLYDCVCSATLTDVAPLAIGPMCKLQVGDGCANFLKTGAPNVAYTWLVTSADSAAWPAAGDYVTDAKGAELLRSA